MIEVNVSNKLAGYKIVTFLEHPSWQSASFACSANEEENFVLEGLEQRRFRIQNDVPVAGKIVCNHVVESLGFP